MIYPQKNTKHLLELRNIKHNYHKHTKHYALLKPKNTNQQNMDYIIRYLNQQKAGISDLTQEKPGIIYLNQKKTGITDLNQKKADTTYLKA